MALSPENSFQSSGIQEQGRHRSCAFCLRRIARLPAPYFLNRPMCTRLNPLTSLSTVVVLVQYFRIFAYCRIKLHMRISHLRWRQQDDLMKKFTLMFHRCLSLLTSAPRHSIFHTNCPAAKNNVLQLHVPS